MQALRHAPGLKVIVYDGVSRKTPKDEDHDKKRRKSKKSFKKMSREERFKTSAVRPSVLETLSGIDACLDDALSPYRLSHQPSDVIFSAIPLLRVPIAMAHK